MNFLTRKPKQALILSAGIFAVTAVDGSGYVAVVRA